jgi:hypothetical protein
LYGENKFPIQVEENLNVILNKFMTIDEISDYIKRELKINQRLVYYTHSIRKEIVSSSSMMKGFQIIKNSDGTDKVIYSKSDIIYDVIDMIRDYNKEEMPIIGYNEWKVRYVGEGRYAYVDREIFVYAKNREEAIENARKETLDDIKLIKSVEKALGYEQNLRIKNTYANGGGVGSDKWQIQNSAGRYYSVSMQTGNPVFNESPDLGYSYKKEEAENIIVKVLNKV